MSGATYTMHVLTGPGGTPRCGAPDPGPVAWGQVSRVLSCLDCMTVGAEGLPHEATMAGHLERVRADLHRKLRGLSAADRADYKQSIFSAAAAGLADPDSAPALYDKRQLLAALYALGAVRAGAYQLRRAGGQLSFTMLETALHELEMITVALAEGTPL